VSSLPSPRGVSDHFDGERFFNLYGPTVDRSLGDAWRWKSRGAAARWPPPTRLVVRDEPPRRVEGLRIVLVGHASLLIQAAGCTMLIDPVWSERASPLSWLGPRRHQPPGIGFDALPRIDAVLITHSHYDHMDIATLRRLHRRDRPRLIAPLGNDMILGRAGLRAETADWWERVVLTERVAVALCPANHWSSRTLFDRRRALWCGYVLQTPAGAVYLAGDTGYGDGTLFAEVRRRHGPLAVAVLPIGAYEPRWFMAPQHMNPDEAVRALLGCGAAQGLGVHWGTFQLTDEAREAPRDALAAARAEHGVPDARFRALVAGEVWQA
jgi:L-ascorbate metabolism protein UlaG (beta-lactamase superfamily)